MTTLTIPAAVLHHFLGLPDDCTIAGSATVEIEYAPIPDDKPQVRPVFKRVGNGATAALVFAGFKAVEG